MMAKVSAASQVLELLKAGFVLKFEKESRNTNRVLIVSMQDGRCVRRVTWETAQQVICMDGVRVRRQRPYIRCFQYTGEVGPELNLWG